MIECGCHGSRFDMRTGEVLGGTAVVPIAVFQARDEGGDLQVST